jgi:hypothetical protein
MGDYNRLPAKYRHRQKWGFLKKQTDGCRLRKYAENDKKF